MHPIDEATKKKTCKTEFEYTTRLEIEHKYAQNTRQ